MDYQAFFEQSSALMIVIDTKLNIVSASDEFLKASKTSREKIIGVHLFDVFPDNTEEINSNGGNSIRASFNRVFKTKAPDILEVVKYDIPNPNGGGFIQKYWKTTHSPVFDSFNEVQFIIQVAEDITENELLTERLEKDNKQIRQLKENEQHFKHLADLLPAKISNANKEGGVIYFNKHWLDYTGLSFEGLKDLGYHNILHPDELEEFQKRFKEATETKTVLEMEMQFLDKNGDYKWHLNLVSPILDEDQEIKMWVGSTTEIQHQKEQTDSLKKAVKERTKDLERANVALIYQNEEKEKRAEELFIANKELAYQNEEKEKRAEELVVANRELAFQNKEKEKRAAELSVANIELAYQNDEKEKRAKELIVANKELAFQNSIKEKRAKELVIANNELAFQNKEKEKRATELVIANKELAFQNKEKEKRAAELIIANYARSLLEASLDPLVTISASGKILDVNEASVKVTGVLREKLIDTDFSNYFTEPKKAQEGYRQVFEKGFVADYPLTIKHKNGNLTDVLYNASVYKDDKGNVLGVFAAARDVTEHKKVENVLKESEKKFKLIFEKSIAPIIVADDKGNYLEVNKAAEEIFGYSINELIGMNVGDLITTSNPNAAAQYEQYIKKGEEKGEFGFKSKKGAPKIVQYQAVRIKPDFNLSILMDVTEQKKSSQYARSLIEASLDPLVTISASGKILDVNEASVKVTGVPREKLIDTDFSNYFTEPTKAQEGYRQVFEKGFVEDYPLTIKHKNGTLTDVLYNASVYKDDKGNVLGVFAAARDVTAQKKSSQYARSLIEASLDPLVTISASGKILDVNEASVKVTGVPREKLIDTDFSNYFTEPTKAQEGYRQVFEKGFVEDYPLTIKHKNGNLTDVLYNASVYKDDKGNVLGVFAAARDVTAQKKSSQYARSLIEASLDPLVTISANGKILDVNEASVKVTGVPREKLIDTDFSNYFTEPTKAQEGYRQVFEKGFVEDYPLTIKHKNGNLTDVLYNASVYKDDNGNVLGVFAAARDVTEQKWVKDLRIANKELVFQNEEKEKRAKELNIANKELAYQSEEKEKRAVDLVNLSRDLKAQQQELKKANDLLVKQDEKVSTINHELSLLNLELEKRVVSRTKALEESEIRFRNMMETIPQISWTNTLDGKFTFYNQRWYDYTGLNKKETKELGPKSIIHPDDFKIAHKEYHSILKNGNGGEFQTRGKREDGIYRWHLIRLMPIKTDDENEVQLWVGTATDIEDLRVLQQQKDDFISIASHELKTPITALKASLQIMNRMKENPSSALFANLIGRASISLDKVSSLVENLLNTSKANEGQIHLNQKRFVISKVVEDCCSHVRDEGTYTIKTIGDLELEVFADAMQIDQVIINLVNNAIKYAPKSKEVIVKIERLVNSAKISVSDQGPGIEPEKQRHLFDRYYRVDSSGSQYSGLGLGLYISAEIIKRHKGQIGVDSELGKGSTFWFTLPI